MDEDIKDLAKAAEGLKLTAVAALTYNRVIGVDGKYPFRLPEHDKRIHDLVAGRRVIIGHRSVESLPDRLLADCGVLHTISRTPNRAMHVSLVGALEYINDTGVGEAIVLGGGQIFKQLEPLLDRIYYTQVCTVIGPSRGALTQFPHLSGSWKVSRGRYYAVGERLSHSCSLFIYDRI